MTDLEFFALLALVASTAALVAGLRSPSGGGPPLAALLAVAAGAMGLLGGSAAALWACIGLTVAGVLLPARLFAGARRAAARGDFERAARLLGWLTLLRRTPALRRWRDLWSAAAAFYAGNPRPAHRLASELATADDPLSHGFREALAALTRDWARGRYARAVDLQSRSLCELGAVEAGVEVAARVWAPRMTWARVVRARGAMLAPLAFAGRQVAVDDLARLLRLPPPQRDIWRATALAAAGHPEAARGILAALLEQPDLYPALRASARARLDALPGPTPLGPSAREVLSQSEREIEAGLLTHLRAPWRSPVTLGVLLLLTAVHVAQLIYGGPAHDYRLIAWGALWVDGAWPDEPHRLLTYGLLHAGPVHLATNAVAVALLGPLVAGGLGELRALAVFVGAVLAAGVGISFLGTEGMTVGASGGAMGLLGALVVIVARHPRTRGTRTGAAAWRPLVALVVLQALLDAAVPVLSFTGHATGALSGALLAVAALSVPRFAGPPPTR